MTVAYVYKWTHIPSLQWYVGSRTAAGCHLNDGYICSSKTVKPLIEASPLEWMRTIIATGTPTEMRELEQEILNTFDAAAEPRSLNRHNATSNFNGAVIAGLAKSEAHRTKLVAHLQRQNAIWRKGKPSTFAGKKHTSVSLSIMSSVKEGEMNPNNKWVFVSPIGIEYHSPFVAAKEHKCSHTSIYRWCKQKANGWSMHLNTKGNKV